MNEVTGLSTPTANDHESRKRAGAAFSSWLLIGLEDRDFAWIHLDLFCCACPSDALEMRRWAVVSRRWGVDGEEI